jgi:hypothetical protein
VLTSLLVRASASNRGRGAPTRAEAWFADLPLHSGFALRVYEPADAEPSWWFDGLHRFGPSIHLLSFAVTNIESSLRGLAQHGYHVLQRGERYAYVDCLSALGIVLEVVSES